MGRVYLLVALLTGVLLGLVPESVAGPPGPFQIVVHPGRSGQGIDRATLTAYFLKKATRWPDGEMVRPVDLEPKTEVRRAFSESVLRRSVGAVKAYWQQAIFSGRDTPPPELESDEAVIRYVSTTAGAIGYVSGGSPTDLVKVVPVE